MDRLELPTMVPIMVMVMDSVSSMVSAGIDVQIQRCDDRSWLGSGFLFNILLGDIEYYSSLHSLAKSK